MSILLLHGITSTTTDQNVKEATAQTEPVRTDNDTAEAVHAPDWNEFDSDESGQLVGLSHREVGSHTVDTVKYGPWWAGNATMNHNEIIDNQVASSGTAAAREMSGQQGHGTLQYAEGIEPVIRPGASFGNDYFLSNPAQVQDGAGQYMAPTFGDNWGNAVAQRDAVNSSREAASDSLYAAFLS